ncbi:hypothetical protein EJ08DRAFT_682678 [Tothia fuscella]|uniref:Uncharacterized protein n=1 Tax=Tothia fuscella TaxID=1048955 RepID=A0A9P4TUP1_9PEZI|nr:hypothetical protein EJ08DRAFT_682678 [Tothia fuscella]
MDNSLPSLLSNLQTSLESANLPAELDVLPPPNGISLLDVKNELFLSYLQNLVFLILIKLRHASNTTEGDDVAGVAKLNEDATKKLAELRLYLEKGVKPLEARLKYQIDKVVKAADDAAWDSATNGAAKSKEASKKARKEANGDGSASDAGTDSNDDSDASSEVNELSYRPNPAALLRPSAGATTRSTADEPSDGIYRPPRITATSMPTTKGKEERTERRPLKSATLDEYIATELSTAPVAEPNIGSTIASGGRRTKTQRERDDEANRTRFEEENLMRLPKESKKDKAPRGGGVDRNGGYGGEEWRDLGAGLDRIENLVKRKSGGKLDASRKRKIDVGDGPRDSGAAAGTEFAKRKKTVMRRFR